MKKILLAALCILTAAAWLLLTRGSEPVSSPVKENNSEVKSIEKDKVTGSKSQARKEAENPGEENTATLTSDCLKKKEVISKCTNAKGEKKSTSPTLTDKEESLSEGNYSRLPE